MPKPLGVPACHLANVHLQVITNSLYIPKVPIIGNRGMINAYTVYMHIFSKIKRTIYVIQVLIDEQYNVS